MISEIKNCRRCELYKNQKPLLDNPKSCEVFWVGLSAKITIPEEEVPLSPYTISGQLIERAEALLHGVRTYKTNLVKCVPLVNEQKLRYPLQAEIRACINHLITEIKELSPKLVFLLGEKVYSAVGKRLNIKFEKWSDFDYKYVERDGVYYIPIHHPSYIYVYKRKHVDDYINAIQALVERLLT